MLRLVNRYEEIAHGEIKLAADRWDLSVYPKVRVADVVSLDEVGAKGVLKRYGLQAHFDFVICREKWDPIYAIEFDGRYHSTNVQKARDAKKDELCRRANFPILRINSKYLSKDFGNMSLVAWIMDVFELQEGFYKAQEEGTIQLDEPFDPFLFMGMNPGEDRFPYWFSAKPRIKLRKLYEAGKIVDPISSGFIGYDAEDVMRGVEYIRVTATEGLLVRSAMRPQQFPIMLSDLLDEILSVQLAAEVLRWCRGETRASPLHQLYHQVESTKKSVKLARAHSSGHWSNSE